VEAFTSEVSDALTSIKSPSPALGPAAIEPAYAHHHWPTASPSHTLVALNCVLLKGDCGTSETPVGSEVIGGIGASVGAGGFGIVASPTYGKLVLGSIPAALKLLFIEAC
jgi:hypothetical protein